MDMSYEDVESLRWTLNNHMARLYVYCISCKEWVARGLNVCPACGCTSFRDLAPADFIEAELAGGI